MYVSMSSDVFLYASDLAYSVGIYIHVTKAPPSHRQVIRLHRQSGRRVVVIRP